MGVFYWPRIFEEVAGCEIPSESHQKWAYIVSEWSLLRAIVVAYNMAHFCNLIVAKTATEMRNLKMRDASFVNICCTSYIKHLIFNVKYQILTFLCL